jgi:energy-coupling factor transporter ATP-binding protein EcfA2
MDKMTQGRMKQFYNNLNDRPLEPNDDYYVPFLERTPGDPIKNLYQKIIWSEAASINLLTGQRGSGKSTELRRLKTLLEKDGCIVFLCDMQDYMNLTTSVEVTDFFISVMGALSDKFSEKFGHDPAHESYWERIRKFLTTEIKIDQINVEAGAGGVKAGIKASLKEDPTFRKLIQDRAKGYVARLTQQAQEFATAVVQDIRAKENDADNKVVLIVDSVEQIRGVGDDADNVYRSVENLFSGHADKLHLPLLHVVYTIPPYLTPITPGLGRQLGGGTICNLPSVHVMKREIENNTCADDPNGLSIMREIISKRCAAWQDFFSHDQMDRIARMTGGDLRDFFRMTRECLVKAGMNDQARITDDIVTDAENQLRRDMLPIAKEDLKWLSGISRRKTPNLEAIKDLPRLARFFDTHLVLNYRNNDDWYDVHPLLQKVLEGVDATGS